MIQAIIIICTVITVLGFTIAAPKPKEYKKIGNEKYCLINYNQKQIECLYNTVTDCHNQFVIHPDSICFKNKELK